MLTIVSMNRAGLSDERLTFKVEFEFDNASTLPERAFNVGNMSYVLAKGSTAKNVVTGTNYEYTGSKWVKTSEITNSTSKTSTITDNGNYNVTNNDFVGFSDVTVDVSAEPPVLIEKSITENGEYNASDDNADGYSKVTVNVAGGGGETFEVEVEVTFTDTAPITTVNKTYQQIKSEIDLGKTISGTLRITYNSLVSYGELSISYVRDFYYTTKVASDAIFIVTEPFLLNLTSEHKMNFIIPVVITPDNKVWLTMTNDWVSNPET